MLIAKTYNILRQGNSLIIKDLSINEIEKFIKSAEKKALKNQNIIIYNDKMSEFLRLQQIKAIYSLLNVFIDSGQSSFNDLEDMKDHYKNILGEIKGYEYLTREDIFLWIQNQDNLKKNFVKKKEDIPINTERVYTIYKSTSNISKEKGCQFIKLLIKDIIEAGISGGKFEIIMQGMEENGLDYKNYIASYNQHIK